MCSIIQSNNSGNSIDKDIYYERTRQIGAGKYLRESYYYCIECSAANSLAALMRKWYLNSSFQPQSYSPETSGRCWYDRNQHQQFNLHVEGRDERKKDYKIEGKPWDRGIENLREKYCNNKNCSYHQLQEIYTRINILGLCWKRFFFKIKLIYLCFLPSGSIIFVAQLVRS